MLLPDDVSELLSLALPTLKALYERGCADSLSIDAGALMVLVSDALDRRGHEHK